MLIRHLNTTDDLDAFCTWAFGSGHKHLCYSMQMLDAWNSLHGDDLRLNGSGNIGYDCGCMVDLWRKRVNK